MNGGGCLFGWLSKERERFQRDLTAKKIAWKVFYQEQYRSI